MILPRSFHFKLGRLLRERRRARHITQSQLALQCATGKQFISNIERGNSSPPLRLLARLLRSLDIEPGEVAQLLQIEIEEVLTQLLKEDLKIKEGSTND